METYIAIDNVCAWPNLTLLPDGTIAAVLFNKPNHSLAEGEVECWVSSDGGRLWRKQGVPVSSQPGDNRMNHAAGLAHNGDLIVLCSGWTPAQPPRKVLEPVVCRSRDGGCTWVQEGDVGKPEQSASMIPYGDIVRGGDGLLGASFYSYNESNGQMFNYFLRSYDDGRTWVEPVRIGQKNDGTPIPGNETALLCIDGKRLVAAGRTKKERNLELYASEDFGKTWTHQGALTLGNQHPAHLLMLEDGRLLLTYGMRNKGFYGIGARVSRDLGASWDFPIHLVRFEIATDGGYPSSVQLDDGTIVTAYYSDKVPFHHRYHMGVARWKPDM
ncbi:exo-alpha-sialidase [Paenibacillus hemerocallicola]|uniref:Exo-alpha-sialidase n=1 Tax=Paenibacillus hemerocallicola TaxID=1172614 RepID=A0A5C4T4N9_9BACL|nr:sialidase family protein [Paenibacillus hemerocallicola]TNJ63755.1 exo-alpha-sialidase [Paenibacillus hemerocallicola]